jgi:NADH-quinone oxidoreductase subunit H
MTEPIALASSFLTPGTWQFIVLSTVIKGGIVLFTLLTLAGYAVFAERKVIARLQHRIGPNRAGPFGLLQPLADVLKLLTKEDSCPPFVDKWLFIAAPAIVTITGLLGFAIIPLGDHPWLVVADLNLGILFFLALSSLGVYSIVFAGWSSNSKYAVLGGLRATAQMVSYELSMGMALLGVVMMAGSFNLSEIVRAQNPLWFLFLQPIGFFVFLVSIFAESRRTPFDLPEAENEIVAGFHTEYSSMKFALFFLGEYVGVMLLSFVLAIAYLGGWSGPWFPGPWWLFLKVGVLIFFFIWIRATFPRFRYDHLMEIGWRYLLPLSVLNIIITAVLALALPELVPNAVK